MCIANIMFGAIIGNQVALALVDTDSEYSVINMVTKDRDSSSSASKTEDKTEDKTAEA